MLKVRNLNKAGGVHTYPMNQEGRQITDDGTDIKIHSRAIKAQEAARLQMDKLRKKFNLKGQLISTELVKYVVYQKGGKTKKNFEYIGCRNKFLILCEKGHKFKTNWITIKCGHWCPRCAVNKNAKKLRKGEKEIRKFIENKGGALDENWQCPTNNQEKFWVGNCGEGHSFKSSWTILQQGSWCPQCANVKVVNDKDVRNYIENKGGVLDENWKYNAKTKFWIKDCGKGHSFKTNWHLLKIGCWCPICGIRKSRKKLRKNEEEIREFIENKGGVLGKDWHYKNCSMKFWIESCGKGHRFETSWDMLRRGGWCPYCIFKTEQEFRKKIEKVLGIPFSKKRPKWLLNINTGRALELDGYNKEHKIAFEYQGIQHYKSGIFGNKKDLKEQKERDNFKKEQCEKRGILLIRIPYWIPKSEWKNRIKQCKDLLC